MKLRIAFALMFLAVFLAGCNKEQPQDVSQTTAKQEHDHSGWWCEEHGIPEDECSMCLSPAELKKRFKDKGDWCDKHERADSQCFICHPEYEAKFAAKYEAKYGKKPPPRTEK
jgi:cobalt-zinc-cadmium efflux system membrane fusion protein